MFSKKPQKTNQSVFKAFTEDLQEIKDREELEAEQQAEIEIEAASKKLEAIKEAGVAARAITNITKMLTGAK